MNKDYMKILTTVTRLRGSVHTLDYLIERSMKKDDNMEFNLKTIRTCILTVSKLLENTSILTDQRTQLLHEKAQKLCAKIAKRSNNGLR